MNDQEKIKGTICKLDTCTATTDGKCIEGFSQLVQCPNYIIEEGIGNEPTIIPETLEKTLDIKTQVAEPDFEVFYDGYGLTFESAYDILRKTPNRLILVAGSHECGKTTLLSSIYELFQEGHFADHIFAGSFTLPAWEKRCHLARIASNRSNSDTERTKTHEDFLLHLFVRSEKLDSPIQSLLFSDLAGERFRLVKDSTEECQKFKILLRTDHFVLLIDGGKISQAGQRQEAFAVARSLLRSCLDSGMIGKKTFVEVVFTKWDLIKKKIDDEDLKIFIEQIEQKFQQDFSARTGRLSFFKVAARPLDGSLAYGYNLDLLFHEWVNRTPTRNFYTPIGLVENEQAIPGC